MAMAIPAASMNALDAVSLAHALSRYTQRPGVDSNDPSIHELIEHVADAALRSRSPHDVTDPGGEKGGGGADTDAGLREWNVKTACLMVGALARLEYFSGRLGVELWGMLAALLERLVCQDTYKHTYKHTYKDTAGGEGLDHVSTASAAAAAAAAAASSSSSSTGSALPDGVDTLILVQVLCVLCL